MTAARDGRPGPMDRWRQRGPDADSRLASLERERVAEHRRRQAVERLGILGTPADERFDRVTRLAATVLRVPVVIVTVSDGPRLWIKSSHGSAVEEMQRTASLCEQTMRRTGPFIVPDLAALDAEGDPSLWWAATQSRELGFYAGYPLHDEEGVVVGTFAIGGPEPRTLEEHELATFVELAGWVEHELRVWDGIGRTRLVQDALLARTVPRLEGWDVADLCLPTLAVGGDFVDHEQVGDEHHSTVADVMGKGAAAALVMATARAVVRGERRAMSAARPDAPVALDALFGRVNTSLGRDLGSTGSFLTAFRLGVRPRSPVVRWVDAGHGLALVVHAAGGWTRLSGEDLPLALDQGSSWQERETRLAVGDTLVVFSDGLYDLLDEHGDVWRRLAGFTLAATSAQDVVETIRGLVREQPPGDDVTAVVLRRT
ncbi:MAG: SpoIIE family protein phosphatase [Nocardioidaceae bacterium]|nr:SpoIIE family protein phosphatase [Nocardioidaceae bacterium]